MGGGPGCCPPPHSKESWGPKNAAGEAEAEPGCPLCPELLDVAGGPGPRRACFLIAKDDEPAQVKGRPPWVARCKHSALIPVVTVTGNTSVMNSLGWTEGHAAQSPALAPAAVAQDHAAPPWASFPAEKHHTCLPWLQRKQLKGVSLGPGAKRAPLLVPAPSPSVAERGSGATDNCLKLLLGVCPQAQCQALEPAAFPPWRLRAAHWVFGETGTPGP